MGTRENKVESYLDKEVKRIGGVSYKWTGRPGVPDRIVIYKSSVFFIEVKTTDGVLASHQLREIDRIRAKGGDVRVLFGSRGIDNFILDISNG